MGERERRKWKKMGFYKLPVTVCWVARGEEEVDFSLGRRVAKIKHKNHLQVLTLTAITQAISRCSNKQGDGALLEAGVHITASPPLEQSSWPSNGRASPR